MIGTTVRPRRPPHRVNGRLQLQLGDLQTAEASFRKALSLDGAKASTHYSLARVLLRGHRVTEAIAADRKALELDAVDIWPGCQSTPTRSLIADNSAPNRFAVRSRTISASAFDPAGNSFKIPANKRSAAAIRSSGI